MKKVIMAAAVIGSISFVSKANSFEAANHSARKPLLVVHVVGCGVDTYLYGATQTEINQGVQAIKDAYCWAGQ